jgi:hypothetical protein
MILRIDDVLAANTKAGKSSMAGFGGMRKDFSDEM